MQNAYLVQRSAGSVNRVMPGHTVGVINDDPDDRAEDFRGIAELAEAFTDMVEALTDRHTLRLDVGTLVAVGHRTMPRTQHTGLLLMEEGFAHTVTATSEVPQRLDALRARLGEGPALDALKTNDMVVSGDVDGDPRWPRYGPAAFEELGVRSIACYRLHMGPKHRAALLFTSDWPYAFDELATSVGAIIAAYCSLVLFVEQVLGDRLSHERAAEVHREIGVAVGILLADKALSSGQAYHRLHQASRSLSKSLPEVARHVIEHRTLPRPEPGAGA